MDFPNSRSGASRRSAERSSQEAHPEFRRPLTSQQTVVQEIRRAIANGELKPGARVHQEHIAKRLGVSRVPVREALKGLESEGQVTYRPQHGYAVAELSLEELAEIYLMRGLLETELLRQATPNVDEELIEHLDSLVTEMEELSKAGDLPTFADVNREFHFLLFERANMPQFIRVTEILWRNSQAYRSIFFNNPSILERIQKEHRQIVDACRVRDTEGIIVTMNEHRSNAIPDLKTILE